MYPDVKSKTMSFNRVTLDGLNSIAHQIINTLGQVRVYTLTGEMGSGKTTLVKAFGGELKVLDTMSSPTFSIINEYKTANDEKIYHFDLYRIKSEAEAVQLGADEYFYSGNYCFIEWPDLVQSLLPENFAAIKISVDDSTHRTIDITIHGGEKEKRI